MTRWTRAALITLCSSAIALAEPPKPSIAQAIKDAGFKPGVTCKAVSAGRSGSQSQLYQNTRTKEIVAKKEFWFAQALECRVPGAIPGYPKAHRMFDGSANFHSTGGAWTFDSWHDWDSWLEGMPPPDSAAVAKAIEDKFAILAWNHPASITQIYSYGLRPKAPVLWREVNMMKTEVEVVVDEKYGSDLIKNQLIIKVHFTREDPKGPWKAIPGGDTVRTEISRRTPSEEERKTLFSIVEQEERRVAAARLAVLPKVEVPAFADAKAAQLFVYKVLRESPADEAESYLRRMYSKIDEEDLKETLAALPRFREEYCATARFQSGRTYALENKLESSWTSIQVGQEGGVMKNGVLTDQVWKLQELKVGMVKGDQLAAMKSFDFDVCAGTVPKPSGGVWKVGDPIDAKLNGKWITGVVEEIGGGQVWVKKDNGRYAPTSTRHTLDQLREATGPAPAAAAAPVAPANAPEGTAPVAAAPAPAPAAAPALPFAIGDRVEGNPGGRWFPGTVAGFNSAQTKVFIKYDDKTKEYLPFAQVRKLNP